MTAAKLPPVTRNTLRELDLNWIMHNINLHVDVNYDHDLHFMPIQGPDGEQKRQDAKKYWLALAIEFRIYQHNLSDCPCQRIAVVTTIFCPRLPIMFETLKELLETLVPDRDHPKIAENLDIPLLMQQVRKGILDIVRLSQWIAELLKSHCAPMRDEWADDMAAKIEDGYMKSDMDLIVDGLEKLFGFLEAMKLVRHTSCKGFRLLILEQDVANHQIRTFRYPLIEDTISFQQRYFGRKLQDGRIKAEASRHWYRMARDDHQRCQFKPAQRPAFEPLGALIHGILKQCTHQEKMSKLPDTLAYDRLRIRQLQEDVQDLIYLHICIQVFSDFLRQRFGAVSRRTFATLECRITTIIENDDAESRNESWQAQIADVAMEITQAAYVERGLEHCMIPDDDFKCTTIHLKQAFENRFGLLANKLLAKLEERTFAHAAIFQKQSPLQISEAQKRWQQSRHDDKLWRADMEDVARRVAHIAVLHWKIWAGLVYLEGEEEEEAEGGSMGEDENRPEGLDQISCELRNLVVMEPG